MTTAREAMTAGAECIGENDTIREAAKRLKELQVGSVPICGTDDKLKGMVTDRDIAIKVVAAGLDPDSTTAGSLAKGKPVTIGADDTLEEALRTMSEHRVRRLPVIDGHQLVGMLSQADLARALPDEAAGDLIQAISQD
ncbi:signal transduction protein [Terrabacter tumescens]|uniref:Signal transduction protein n=1 Tax=Terrabacter tumescens TaxID=60443 RepID=A0ABQ2HNB9_9MICO|nr:CBS domain-containing protein [Terrabacter tumescens]GGM83697.1 signal transduction protein [Terrabacter tumescens]